MNRKIKFRAWDTFNERMIDEPYYFRPNLDSSNDAPMQYAELWQDVDDGIWRPCYIMQYTGLKDKNGKEVYEGDILERESPHNAKIQTYGIVKFINGAFRIQWSEIKSGNWNDVIYLHAPESFVIGNIHENPELKNEIFN